MRNTLLLIVNLAFFLGCSKEASVLEAIPDDIQDSNYIDFSAPAVGQESRYLLFEGESRYKNENPSLVYQQDTLVVRIVAEEAGIFTFQEFFSSQPGIIESYQVRIDDDRLLFTSEEDNLRSRLLPGSGSSLIFPLKNIEGPEVEFKGWEVARFCDTAPCTTNVEGYEQLGWKYENLILYHDYGPMAYDGNGYYSLYNEDFGIVRAVTVSAWTGEASGLDLILSQD